MYTSTLTRSSSGKELLLPFGELFHALQGFLLRHNSSRGTFNLEFYEGFSFFHKTSAAIVLDPGNMSMQPPNVAFQPPRPSEAEAWSDANVCSAACRRHPHFIAREEPA
jgi:hypothetical protein